MNGHAKSGRVALVTGGTAGLALGIAKRLIEKTEPMRTARSEERHIVCVVRGQTAHRDRVKELLLDLVGPARLEEDCLYYDIYQQLDEPDTFRIVDGWASEAAVSAHAAHPNVPKVVDQLLLLLASPLEVITSALVSEW